MRSLIVVAIILICLFIIFEPKLDYDKVTGQLILWYTPFSSYQLYERRSIILYNKNHEE